MRSCKRKRCSRTEGLTTAGQRLATLLFLRLALLPRPALFRALPGTPERQRIRRHIFGDAACCRDVSAASNLYWRHQRRVAADEHAIFDDRLVLVDAIVIAGDGTCTDVYAFSDFRVAQIAEVILLRTLAQLDFLGLDKVSHVGAFAHIGPRAQMRVGSKYGFRADARIFHDRPRLHRDAIAND